MLEDGAAFANVEDFLEDDVSGASANRNVIHASALDALWVAEAQIDPFCPAQIHREPRQQRGEQFALVRAQGMSLAPAEECALPV